ncbi:hypothetical protein C6P45_004148 [Maudiozyma exigua]|uniref:Sodium/calcium exchanger membrane region domain-containing protein n=1 Tax=Maudiozyma exigua TaxID=34358 RepID=A0A9P7BC03_MAUEX|nr:hypothetical protein C6P45_004148 [Kazachstania exigua]
MDHAEWLFKLAHPATLYTNAHLSINFIVPSIFHIVVCFILLGICASDYLCPNVASIADSSYSDHYVTKNQIRNTGALMAVLLSWCNSSPDLFSNLVSWTTSSSPTAAALSIGEVLGACGIILCVVEGSIFIIMSSTTLSITNSQKMSILKDLTFTAVAMLIMTYIAFQNKVTVLNCLLMMSVYVCYVTMKLTFHGKHSSNSNNGSITAIPSREQQQSIHGQQNSNIGSGADFLDQEAMLLGLEDYDDDFDDDLQSFTSGHIRAGIKPSLISAMDYNSLLGMLEHSTTHNDGIHEQAEMMSMQSNSLILPFQGDNHTNATNNNNNNNGANHNIYNNDNNDNNDDNNNDDDDDDDDDNNDNIHASTEHVRPIIPTIEINDIVSEHTSHAEFTPYSDNPDSELESISRSPTPNDANIVKLLIRSKKYRNLTLKIFAPHLINYKSKSKADRVLSILTIPFVLILQIACPKQIDILEYDKSSSKYILTRSHILVLLIQAVCAPLISFTAISCLINVQFANFLWIFPVSITISLMAIITIFYNKVKLHNKFSLFEPTSQEAEEKTMRRRELERLHNIIQLSFLIVGIANSILFISLIANSLIEMMELYQVITGISKAVLGLTIFAWGNSISDLISNIAMCRFYLKVPHQDDIQHIQTIATKFFVISCTSCLGGVMLNSMGGIGLSGFIAMVFVHDHSGQWWFLLSRELEDTSSSRHFNSKFVVSCIFILLQVIFLLVIFGGPKHINQWAHEHRRIIGLIMCGIWGLATLCNVFIEIFG